MFTLYYYNLVSKRSTIAHEADLADRRPPAVQENLTYVRIVRVQPCMRPVFRVEACPVAMQPLWLLALM